MSMQQAVFEMIALGKVEVNGVEYEAGEPFVAIGPQQMRFLRDRGVARGASEVVGDAAVGSVVQSPPNEIDFNPPATGNQGTQDEQAITGANTQVRRAKR